MELPEKIRRLWAHVLWADSLLYKGLTSQNCNEDKVWREFTHIIGAEEIWLARLETRTAHAEIWPQLPPEEVSVLMDNTHRDYNKYLAFLRLPDLDINVPYTNSAGESFTDTVSDILFHVALHGQYHRGKVNLMLSECGMVPVPTDYIAFIRGAPAAITKTSAQKS